CLESLELIWIDWWIADMSRKHWTHRVPRTAAKWALVAILVLFFWWDASAWIRRASFSIQLLRSVKLSTVFGSVCRTDRL
ncbi:TPA: hypothetical protein ACH7ID_004951, partial [Escherichia coli]